MRIMLIADGLVAGGDAGFRITPGCAGLFGMTEQEGASEMA
jgi:hypothetical protein